MKLDNIVREHSKWLANNSNGTKADLSHANLRGAELSDAELSDANLSYANLKEANLSQANLSYANLSYANLKEANLSDADLRFCTGNNKEVRTIQTGKYIVVAYEKWLCIGCKKYLYTEWMEFTDDEIDAMDDGALEWWAAWKPILESINELR